MNKYLLVFILISINSYANKNWIEIKPIESNSSTELKMYTPESSIKRSGDISHTNSSDKDLLELFKTIQDMTQQVQSKIKKSQ